MGEQLRAGLRILRRKEVESLTGLSCSSLYGKMKFNRKRPGEFDATFPIPIRISARAIGWISSEVETWIAAQIDKRDKASGNTMRRATVEERSEAPPTKQTPPTADVSITSEEVVA